MAAARAGARPTRPSAKTRASEQAEGEEGTPPRGSEQAAGAAENPPFARRSRAEGTRRRARPGRLRTTKAPPRASEQAAGVEEGHALHRPERLRQRPEVVRVEDDDEALPGMRPHQLPLLPNRSVDVAVNFDSFIEMRSDTFGTN